MENKALTFEHLRDDKERMSRLYLIQDKDLNLRLYQRNKVQTYFSENKTNRNITLKSRKHGVTTEACLEILDETLFITNFNGLLLAHEKQEAVKIFDKVDFAWRNLGEDAQSLWVLDASNKRELRFKFPRSDDGTESRSSFTVSESGRSGTYNHVHVSELGKLVAKYPYKVRELVSGTFNSVPYSGRIDIESTAEGCEGLFYEMFWSAWKRQGNRSWVNGMNKLPAEYAAFFFNWQWDEEEIAKVPIIEDNDLPKKFVLYKTEKKLSQREISFYYLKWLDCQRDWDILHQEFPTTPDEAFVSSGEKLFDSPEKINWDVKEGEVIDTCHNLLVFDEFNASGKYVVAADVSEGVGGDSSTIAVWNFAVSLEHPKPRIVAEYASDKIEPDMFAYVLRDVANRYGSCLVAVERNNHGHATLAILKRIYPVGRIYTEVKFDKVENKKTEKLGWLTTAISKPKMFFDFKTAINQELIEIPSAVIQYEIRTYDRSGLVKVKADPDATRHYDMLTAAVIGYQMRSAMQLTGEGYGIGAGVTEGGVDW